MAYLHLFQVVPLYSYKLVQHEHTPGCELLGRQRVADGSSSGESVARTEQVLGQTVGAAGQACGARVTPAGTHQGISLDLGAAQLHCPPAFARRLTLGGCLHYIGLK